MFSFTLKFNKPDYGSSCFVYTLKMNDQTEVVVTRSLD